MPAPDSLVRAAGGIDSVGSETIETAEAFADTAARFAADPGTVVLMSGGDLDCARYHILATDPWLSLTARGAAGTATVNGERFSFCGDPLETLADLVTALHLPGGGAVKGMQPMTAGFFGYLAYDLKDHLEVLPRTSVDDLGLPHLCLYAPAAILVRDRQANRTYLHIPVRSAEGQPHARAIAARFKQRLSGPTPAGGSFHGNPAGFVSAFSREAYMHAVARIRDYIAAGHVYQVNMSQRFGMGLSGDPFALYRALYERNPAPFFAYVNAGGHHIVSTSPERFVQQIGRRVETRPIKGTRPRGATPAEDDRLKRELAASRKDDAELSMIVDLLRNDIGKVCAPQSVTVAEHKRLEAYQNVYHLVSVVEGRGGTAAAPLTIWKNGRLQQAAAATIPIADEGVQYGNGFFETLRVEKGTPALLGPHLARFETAWQRLFPGDPPDLTWDDIIDEVIRANDLQEMAAAVKILATRGTRSNAPFDFNLAVSARPYTHRLAEKHMQGLTLKTDRAPRLTPLADFKTLNYLYYLDAGRRAHADGVFSRITCGLRSIGPKDFFKIPYRENAGLLFGGWPDGLLRGAEENPSRRNLPMLPASSHVHLSESPPI